MRKFALLILAAAVLGLMLAPAAWAADAKTIFGTKCAACHGPDGAGKMKNTPDLRAEGTQKKSDADLTAYIKTGNGKAMHAFGNKGVDDETIKALVAHIRTLKK